MGAVAGFFRTPPTLHSPYASMSKHPAVLQSRTGTRPLSTGFYNGMVLSASTIVCWASLLMLGIKRFGNFSRGLFWEVGLVHSLVGLSVKGDIQIRREPV